MLRDAVSILMPHSKVKESSIIAVQIFDQKKFKRRIRDF